MKREKKDFVCYEDGCYYTILWDDKGKEIGSKIVMSVRDGKFCLVRLNWGSELDKERSRRGVVEKNVLLDEANTKILMKEMDAEDERELLTNLRLCLFPHVLAADSEITNLCDHFGAKYEIRYNY